MIRTDDMISAGTMTYRADGSAHDTADLVTDEQIEALRRESDDAGDQVMCCVCFVALGEEFARAAERTQLDDEQAKRAEQWLSQTAARRECARVIQAAAAMNDD